MDNQELEQGLDRGPESVIRQDDVESEPLTLEGLLDSLQNLRATVIALALALVLAVALAVGGFIKVSRSVNVESATGYADESYSELTPLERDCVLTNIILKMMSGGREPSRPVSGCADLLNKAAGAGALPGKDTAPNASQGSTTR